MGNPTNPLLFQVRDPEGRILELRRRTWEDHIRPMHPGVEIDWIRTVVEDPDLIIENQGHGSLNYMKVLTHRRYRLVAAKPRPRDSNPPQWYEVATAYPTAIPPLGHGRIVWSRS